MGVRAQLCIIFALGLGQSVTPICADAQTNYKIAGVVVHAFSDEPVARAEVLIGTDGVSQALQTVLSGDDGRFIFENVPVGKFTLLVKRSGFVSQRYKQHGSYNTAIVVGPGQTTDQITFRLTPAGSISGQVSDESGDGLRGATVTLWSRSIRDGVQKIYPQMNAQTDDEGNYHFSRVAPSSYYVGVDARVWYQSERQVIAREQRFREGTIPRPADRDVVPDVVYPLTFFPKTTNSDSAEAVIVHGGDEQTADITLTAVRAIHVKFNSLGRDPSQFPGVQVARTLFGNIRGFLQADVRMINPGVFEVANLYPGHFKFTVQVQGAGEMIEESGEMDVVDDGVLLLSRNGELAALSGELTLSGQTHLQPLTMVRIRNTFTGGINEAEAQPNGHFEFPVSSIRSGTYLVMIRDREATSVPVMSATGGKVHGNAVEIGAAQTVHLVLSAAGGSYRLGGVALRDGKPAEGMRIVLVPIDAESNPDLLRFEQTDSDGTFSLSAVGAGAYTLLALEDAWDLEWSKPGAFDKYLPGGTVIQVGTGSPKKIEAKVQ